VSNIESSLCVSPRVRRYDLGINEALLFWRNKKERERINRLLRKTRNDDRYYSIRYTKRAHGINNPMIAIDGVPAAKPIKTGVEWYVYHLIKAMNKLQPELEVCVYTHRPLDFALAGNWKNVVIMWPFPGWKWMWSLYLWLEKPEVTFSPGDALPPYIPQKSVQTLHDIAFHWNPELFSAKRVKQLEKDHLRCARVATKLLMVADQTRQDVARAYGVDTQRMTVTPLGIDHTLYNMQAIDRIQEVRAQYQLPQTYFVCVGRLDQRKGQADLLRMFATWREQHADVDLVLVGTPGEDGYTEIQTLAQHLGVHVLGWVDGRDAAAIVAGAKAFVFPTKKEGFGIPILEAMAVGVPVICSNLPALHEVGGEVPLFVDREDAGQWMAAFDRVCGELMEEKIAQGLERVAMFTWEATAQKTLQVLCSILSNNSN